MSRMLVGRAWPAGNTTPRPCGLSSSATRRAHSPGRRPSAMDSLPLPTATRSSSTKWAMWAPDLQRLLIRAIEEKRYFTLGDDKPRESDFRLLTATNIDDGELRDRLDPDFLDRISLLSLTLPPLRDVPDELPWLWETVYQEATRRAGVTKRRAALGQASRASRRKHPPPSAPWKPPGPLPRRLPRPRRAPRRRRADVPCRRGDLWPRGPRWRGCSTFHVGLSCRRGGLRPRRDDRRPARGQRGGDRRRAGRPQGVHRERGSAHRLRRGST